jgi:hypothetical protein
MIGGFSHDRTSFHAWSSPAVSIPCTLVGRDEGARDYRGGGRKVSGPGVIPALRRDISRSSREMRRLFSLAKHRAAIITSPFIPFVVIFLLRGQPTWHMRASRAASALTSHAFHSWPSVRCSLSSACGVVACV